MDDQVRECLLVVILRRFISKVVGNRVRSVAQPGRSLGKRKCVAPGGNGKETVISNDNSTPKLLLLQVRHLLDELRHRGLE